VPDFRSRLGIVHGAPQQICVPLALFRIALAESLIVNSACQECGAERIDQSVERHGIRYEYEPVDPY